MSDETPNTEEKPKAKKPIVKIIIAVVVVILLLVGTAVGTLFATGFFSPKPVESADAMLDAEDAGHGAPAADAGHGAPAKADAGHGAPAADAGRGAPAKADGGHGAPAKADAGPGAKKASAKDGPGGKMKTKSPELTRFEYTYHQLEREFLVNVSSSRKVMSVQIAVMTRYDERVVNNVKKHEFAIRSAVMDVMRLTTEAELAKPDFRKELAVKIRDAMNGLIEKYEDFGGIEEVHFTSFIVQ
ncbi:MAG: flagellar basal body-associated FliL family protein [Comamonadaceae bacterium]